MYSLNNIEQDALTITNYVKACMKEKKLGSTEIKEYEKQARKCNFNDLISLSQEYLDMLNQMNNQQECKVSYIK